MTPSAVGRLDRAVAKTIWRRRTPLAVATARVVGALGDPAIAYPTTIVGCLLTRPGLTRRAVVLLAAGARRTGCEAIARPRPPQPGRLVPTHGHSLPSRHTTLAVLAAGAVVRAAGLPGPSRLAVTLAVGTAVGAARVLLGAHWPTDALAGLGLGLAGWWAADRAAVWWSR
jgi:membrane-associated phospholipid phosphatase